MPGLALAVAKLTVSHAKLLLTVPMIGLRTCPTMSIRAHHATHLPRRPIAHQYFAWFVVAAMAPDDHDSYLVVHFWECAAYR